ncbi:MAG: D-ribitol-5-phosphate cytidylyltransferase [Oscillospiraceae bacterium]|nr:D-ribitol-5-phosphate cytidylyltransferase [Oscillospiraceae bacterium]
MVYAGILAAGMGVRMNRQDMPKPFLQLGKKPIIIHTLEQFFISRQVEKIIVVVHEFWKRYAEDMISKHDTMGKDVVVIAGGDNKTASIKMISEHIVMTWGIHDEDILLAHDAVRPFITQRMIDENIDTADRVGAANTVMTTNDTIIVTLNGRTLAEIPPKSTMFAQQTPITFKLNLLNTVFHNISRQGGALETETEIARLFVQQGYEMQLVTGEYSNMKIINPYDLEVAEALLQERMK